MNTPRRPFRINVGFIVNESIGYSRDFDFEYPSIALSDDLPLTDLRGMVHISRTPQGLLVQGDFAAQTPSECVRCLNEFTFSLNWEFTELYAFSKRSVSESGLLLPEDAHIDLQPLIREYALLEIPISPLCKKDCKGLCLECGEDLNQTDCGHRPEIDSPFSALKNLFKEELSIQCMKIVILTTIPTKNALQLSEMYLDDTILTEKAPFTVHWLEWDKNSV